MNEGKLFQDLKKATAKKIKQFEAIRGKVEDNNQAFWDIVVLSALDPSQKTAYEVQLKEKLERKELPLFTKYFVVNDPVGCKVGNGGGVLAVLDELEKIYGEELEKLKVLILLSGGYSQRLPSASLLGKIFTAMPLGNPIYQMIELKLAMYIEFPRRMKPGLFVASADSIELYELEGEEWNFSNPGVTALAHPSPIEIGTSHGVYVLEKPPVNILENLYQSNEESVPSSCSMGKCRRFLHKPTKDLMRSSGAVFQNNPEEYIYSDSSYYIDMQKCMSLLKWYRQKGGISCEIDAYGDFLQALGPEASSEYCRNIKNVTIALPDLIKTREEIFEVLKDTPLNVLMLNKSRFYHIGTTQEYIEHFCNDIKFRTQEIDLLCKSIDRLPYDMNIGRGCFNCQHNKEGMNITPRAMLKCPWPLEKTMFNESNIFIHSWCNNKSCHIGDNVILEYTFLPGDNNIGSNCIVSNTKFPSSVSVPDNSFLHTVVITDEEAPLYVTVALGIEDDLKKLCPTRDATNLLTYSGLKFGDALDKLHIFQDPWPEDCEQLNLWNAKIFGAFYDPEDSVRSAAEILTACRSNSKYKNSIKKAIYSCCYSMADILRMKDLAKLLEMRNDLRTKILE